MYYKNPFDIEPGVYSLYDGRKIVIVEIVNKKVTVQRGKMKIEDLKDPYIIFRDLVFSQDSHNYYQVPLSIAKKTIKLPDQDAFQPLINFNNKPESIINLTIKNKL